MENDNLEQLTAAANEGGVLCPLPALGLLHVAGADAIAFLHNQLTQSARDLPDNETRLAAWCNAKGRTRALFRLIPSDTGMLLVTDAALLAAIQPKLQMFVLRAQVALTNLSDQEGFLGFAGPAGEALLTEIAGSLPERPGALTRAGDLHVIALAHGERLRYLVLAPKAQLAEIEGRASQALVLGDAQFWNLLDIQEGLPQITEATQESIIPTMLNLEPLGGISYNKGCYPGQEVVARMHYLGQLKRRMYRAHTKASAPAPGDSVLDAVGGTAGTVVSAAPAPDGGSELLAVLRIDSATTGNLSVNDAAIELLDLPYPPPGSDNQA